MRIAVFSHTSSPEKDQPLARKSRGYIKQLLADGCARIVDGLTLETTRAVQLLGNIDRMAHTDTVVERGLGWNCPAGRLQDSAIIRGRAGQNIANYPIPYVFEGHLREPRCAVVNFVPEPAGV